VIAVCLGLTTVAIPGDSSYRVKVSVADITAADTDSLIAVPVYISFPKDTLAGVEMLFRIAENSQVYFASDDVREDGILVAVDTAGTIMSGWEWIGVGSIDNTAFDLKIAGMADWPDQTLTPPAYPTDSALLTTLYFRRDLLYPVEKDIHLDINIDTSRTGFSDPTGNSIGIGVSYKQVCKTYDGDSCVAWSTVPVPQFDTTAVRLKMGTITVPAPDLGLPEGENSENK
jgi:hypothetical protein